MKMTVGRDDNGDVLVGTPPAAPAGAGLVGLLGATAFVDPTEPDAPPYTVVHDLDDAWAGLDAVHGPRVSAAAERVADGAGPVTADAAAPPAALRELGLLRWLERRSPDRLRPAVLDLGIGTAAAALEGLLDPDEADAARNRLLLRASTLADLSRRLRTDADVAPAGLADLVDAALPVAVAVLPFDHPARVGVVHEQELARAVATFGLPRLDWAELTRSGQLADRELVGADRAGDADGSGPQTASVDWDQVPPGVLDTAEDTVTWSVAGDHITVAVRGVPGATAAALAFRVVDAGAVVVEAPLEPADTGEWTGSAALPPSTGETIEVDVFDVRSARAARTGADRIAAQAVRSTARAVCTLRLGGTGGPAGQAAEAHALQAMRLFRQVAARVGDAEAGMVVRRRARSAALARAVVAAGGPGREREARRMRERYGAVTGPVLPSDVAVPDLAGPGWAPLAVELLLGTDPIWGQA